MLYQPAVARYLVVNPKEVAPVVDAVVLYRTSIPSPVAEL